MTERASSTRAGQRSTVARWARRVAIAAGSSALAVGWLWALVALWTFAIWPDSARWTGAAIWLALGIVVLWRFSGHRRVALIVVGILAVRLVWSLNVPTNDRAWTPDQVRLPQAAFNGSEVTVQNVRNATYRTESDYDVVWAERRYSLDAIRTVDFMVEPFTDWRGPAHTLLTFGFADGEYVAISVEIRKKEGDEFSPLLGAFRHYEIAYVVGDERDLLGLRANVRHDPVFLFPIRTTTEKVRALFISMLDRANQLAAQPEFYNTFTNTCATNIVRHVNELRTDRIWPDWRTFLPGYSDELAWDLELIDFTGTLEGARERFLINERSAFDTASDGRAWSRQIRAATAPGSP